MRKNNSLFAFLCVAVLLFSGCSMSFGGPGSGDPGQKDGPGSGEEGDMPEEPKGPDSGDDYDTTIPGAPDSGDEIELGPDSGEEIDTSGQPDGPGSGPEGDMPEEPEEDEGQYDDEDESDEPTSPDSGEEIESGPDSGEDYTARASCNAIDEGSTCVDYVGSFWTSTNAKLNCSSSGAFSLKPCPRPALGGCRIGAGSATEVVTWHYSYGGDPYTEVIQYASMSCNALPGGQWIQ